MDGQKNTHLDFLCVTDELSLEHTPLSVLLMNCLHSKIPFSVLRRNCLQSKIPFSVLRRNCLHSKIPFSVLKRNCLHSKIPFSVLRRNCLKNKIPFSVLRRNCLKNKIPFSVLRMNCLQSKIPFSVLRMNCYRRFPAKLSTILTAEYNPCSPLLIDPPSINHSTGVTGMRQPVRRVTFRAQSAIELLASRLNKLQKYDLVGPVSHRSMTLWVQSVTEV